MERCSSLGSTLSNLSLMVFRHLSCDVCQAEGEHSLGPSTRCDKSYTILALAYIFE